MTLRTDLSPSPGGRRWLRLSFLFMATGIVTLLAAGALFVLNYVSDDERFGSGPETVTAFGPGLDYYLTPQPTLPPTATPPSSAPITRLVIPRFDVDARVVVLGVDERGIMESPEGPWDVAWYDFSARPGGGSNAVFSGHVDWYNIGPGGGPGGAVFWHLKDLEPGDVIEVRLADGTVYKYRMASRQQVDPTSVDVNAVVGRTEREVITLITCGGSFNRETRHYDQRVIIRAERVVEQATN